MLLKREKHQIDLFKGQGWHLREIIPYYVGALLLFYAFMGISKSAESHLSLLLMNFGQTIIFGVIVGSGLLITLRKVKGKVSVLGVQSADLYWIIICFVLQHGIFTHYFIRKLGDIDLIRFTLLSAYNFFSNILSPIIEEYLISGLMLIPACKIFGLAAGVISVSILRALTHLNYNSIQLFSNFIVFGIIGSYLYLRTKRLVIPIIYHSLLNFLITLRDWPILK